MGNKMIKVGIVGSGFAANFHFCSYLKIPGINVKVTTVYSKNKENCQKFASQRKIIPSSSMEELINQVDVVDLCVPGFLHEKFAIQALNANKDVIVEKPFTGYYGKEGDEQFLGNRFSKEIMLKEALASARRMLRAEEKREGC